MTKIKFSTKHKETENSEVTDPPERMPHLVNNRQQHSTYIVEKFTAGLLNAQSSPKHLNKQKGFIQTLQNEQEKVRNEISVKAQKLYGISNNKHLQVKKNSQTNTHAPLGLKTEMHYTDVQEHMNHIENSLNKYLMQPTDGKTDGESRNMTLSPAS